MFAAPPNCFTPLGKLSPSGSADAVTSSAFTARSVLTSAVRTMLQMLSWSILCSFLSSASPREAAS
eukprot:8476773-Lingulodinium_polyedra.AAC.1